ncbi:helix-turn-helix domain-containing protein [Plantactinospora siamensis]|uniref:Helix-turn-helix domain-containing protein n=1 Tax=Plantactinospora siamensis TaxID=555372 RepID=A0ABV6P6I8_9ACTN
MADTIGARIRYWRLRRGGMTQATLAGLAGVTQSYISQIEAGRKAIERRSTLVAIATALQVTVLDLLGQPGDPTDPAKAGAAQAVPAIWAALIEIEEGERRAPGREPGDVAAAIAAAADLRARSDYATMARQLPALLLDAAATGPLELAQVGYETSVCLRNLGYRHLSLPAARIALAGARDAGHDAWIGAARFVYTLALPIEAAPIAARTAGRSLSDLQAAAARPDVRQMLGQLHLTAALSSAVDQRTDDAQAHLGEAEREAATLGDPPDGTGFNLSCFGPTNVTLWRMAVATELGDYGRVVELARTVRPDGLRVANRHQSYWLNLGRALAHSGRADREALVAFMHAERAAPVPFGLNPLAREAVAGMVYRARRRSVSEDLRILARRVGITVAV